MSDSQAARVQGLKWTAISALFASGLVLTGCGSEDRTSLAPLEPGVPTQALFAFYADGEGELQVARIDPVSLQVLETKHIPFSASGGKQKSYYYENRYVWTAQGPNVYGLDPETLEPVQGLGGPYIQGNRSGQVGLALVNNEGAGVAALSLQRLVEDEGGRELLQRTSWTQEEMNRVDLCTLNHALTGAARTLARAGGVSLASHLEPADVRFHNMGYSPVGNETSPDGKLLMHGVRQGDHILFLDTDPESENFGRPARFVYPRYGFVKDATNAVVATFDSVYDQAPGGTAPGALRYNRAAGGAASETDPQTYVEPCDSTMLRNAQGVVWSWTPDVDGDTITGMNVDSINTDAPEVYNIAVPVVRKQNLNNTGVNNASGIPSAGPWMASLVNRNVGNNDFLMFVEYEGENAEGIWDVTDPAQIHEIQRMYNTLADIVDPGMGGFISGNDYQVDIDYTTTGGAVTSVTYRYVALAGDDGSGASSSEITTAYLAKVDSADPGPRYLLNGLTGRASTSNGSISRRSGSGEDSIIFSDEVWLTTSTGADGLQIVDLRTPAPYRITETLEIPSAFSGYFSPDGSKYLQVIAGNIQVIDRQNRSLSDVITLPGSVSAIALGTYMGAAVAPAPSPGAPGGGGGGGAAPLPPNPCGG